MARRVSLPAADDLFRPTVESTYDPVDGADTESAAAKKAAARRPARRTAVSTVADVEAASTESVTPAATKRAAKAAPSKAAASKNASGRVKHDEKMTVYVTSDELLDLEHARLMLRRNQGLAVDRGRLVREAIALVLAEFEELGDESALVKRLVEE